MSMLVDSFRYASGPINDPFYSTRQLILDLDTNLTDYSGTPATITAHNGAAISGTRSKFGTGSLFLDGTNDHLTTNAARGFTTGAFTLEAHIRPTGAQAGRILSIQDAVNVNAYCELSVQPTGFVRFALRDSTGVNELNLHTSAGLIAMNDTVWYHVAVTRDGSGNVTTWIEGVSRATATSTISPADSFLQTWDIGSQYTSAEFYKGYLGNIRVTNGRCEYTGTFTPPAAPYPHS